VSPQPGNSYRNSFSRSFLCVNVAGSWLFFTAVPFNCHENKTATGMRATDNAATVVKPPIFHIFPRLPALSISFPSTNISIFYFLVPGCIYDSITFITKSGCKMQSPVLAIKRSIIKYDHKCKS